LEDLAASIFILLGPGGAVKTSNFASRNFLL